MRMRAGERTVTAVMGQDGKVYFEFQRVAKPVRARLPISLRIPDWMSVSLSLAVAAVVVVTAFLI